MSAFVWPCTSAHVTAVATTTVSVAAAPIQPTAHRSTAAARATHAHPHSVQRPVNAPTRPRTTQHVTAAAGAPPHPPAHQPTSTSPARPIPESAP